MEHVENVKTFKKSNETSNAGTWGEYHKCFFSNERNLQHIKCHNIQIVWQSIEKSDEHEVAGDARKHFFRERNS